MKISYPVSTAIVNASPPTWQGQQGVSNVTGTSYSINLTMNPSSIPFPGVSPTLYGSTVDSVGGTNYFTTVALNGNATTTSVPVKITVITNPPGAPIVQPVLNITIILEYDGFGKPSKI